MPRTKSFEDEVLYYREKQERLRREVAEAFATSAAVHAHWGGKHPREELWILSRDTHPVDEGKDRPWRISKFGKDGPYGHETGTKTKLFELAADTLPTSLTPMTEADVIEWTSTPEYERGVKHVAFMQAVNTVAWKAGGHPPNEAELRAAYDAGWKLAHEGQIEEATELLERALGARRPPPEFTPNPAWITKVVADNYDKLVRELGPAWLPKFGELRSSRNRISASLKELGCGAYGCVLPMERSDMVLKITTDPSEMDFVVKILPDLPAEITVKYKAWMWLKSTHSGRRVGLLWREAADWVGNIEGALPPDRALDALVAIRAQHDAASDAVHAVLKGQMRALPGLIAVWGGLTQRMMRIPELAFVARGMLEAWNQKGVFFADVHEGNLGRVIRDGQPTWVITDPGNVIVIGSDETETEPEERLSEEEVADLEKLFEVNPSDMSDIARQRVLEPLIGEKVSHRRQVDLEITRGHRETWDIAYTTGRNIGSNPAGRILIVLPRGDLRDPLAGLTYSFEDGSPVVTHVWVDSDVRRRGISRVLFDAFRSEFGEELIVAGPFTPAGRAAVVSAGAKIINPAGGMEGVVEVPFPFERKPQIPGSWHKRARVGDVDLSRLIATQRYVFEAGLAKYKKRKMEADQDLPLVYRTDDGRCYVADGHHRLTAARLRGETHSSARIVDIGDPDHPR